MKNKIEKFWENVGLQNADKLEPFFDDNAVIRWHNTNEEFSTKEFVIATCEYPDKWQSEIERIESFGDIIITATKVVNLNTNHSYYATSFFTFLKDKIVCLDEYWGDNGLAPQWRIGLKIGKPIK